MIKKPQDVSGPGPGAPLLLLVDDHPEALRSLIPALQPVCRVALASTGQQGLQRAQALRPDMILLDIGLPDMDGFALCRLLKTDPLTRPIPVLFLSAHNAPEQRVQGLSAGGVDYIAKPYHPEEVVARVQIHLELSAQIRHGAVHAPDPEASAAEERDPGAVLATTAASYIREHLAEPLTVSQIARQVGVHEKRLLALFREHFGQTVSGFLSDERVRTGQRLLADTEMPVQEIAFIVGYGNPGNFATAFRERHGLTPLAFRQALRDQRRLSNGS